jgi:hypothetical protein
VLSVAAAGNDGSTRKSYPASYASVISVAAVDSTEAVASFSQKNDAVELAAPGVGVLSTTPFKPASLSAGGRTWLGANIDGSARKDASGTLVNGGLCEATSSTWSGKVVLCRARRQQLRRQGQQRAGQAAESAQPCTTTCRRLCRHAERNQHDPSHQHEPGGWTGGPHRGGQEFDDS